MCWVAQGWAGSNVGGEVAAAALRAPASRRGRRPGAAAGAQHAAKNGIARSLEQAGGLHLMHRRGALLLHQQHAAQLRLLCSTLRCGGNLLLHCRGLLLHCRCLQGGCCNGVPRSCQHSQLLLQDLPLLLLLLQSDCCRHGRRRG